MKRYRFSDSEVAAILAKVKSARDLRKPYVQISHDLWAEGIKDTNGGALDTTWLNCKLVEAYPEYRRKHNYKRAVMRKGEKPVAHSARERAADIILRAEGLNIRARVEIAMELLTTPEEKR